MGIKLKIDDTNSKGTYSLDRRPRNNLDLEKIPGMQLSTTIGIQRDGKNIPIKGSINKSFTGNSISGFGSEMAAKKSENLYPGKLRGY